MSPHRLLLVLWLFVFDRLQCAAYIRSNRCYSCMSMVYKSLFEDPTANMGRYFIEPRNFTDQCNEPNNAHHLGFVQCRTICLTLTQDFVVMGKKTGRKMVIRGCSSSINRFGFFNRTLELFDRYDICRDIKASDLFRYETDSSQTINVCSCLGDRCNGGSVNSGRTLAAQKTLLLLVIAFASLLFSASFEQFR
uniref:Uncharacterized protein n=1 Tax=Plectus sambesii TaxID=2011161 RepID=A0A914V013_9BILA